MPSALTWEPADRPEWELSRRWHADVAASSGFSDHGAGQPGLDVVRHPVLSTYLGYHLPYYELLYARRLTV